MEERTPKTEDLIIAIQRLDTDGRTFFERNRQRPEGRGNPGIFSAEKDFILPKEVEKEGGKKTVPLCPVLILTYGKPEKLLKSPFFGQKK